MEKASFTIWTEEFTKVLGKITKLVAMDANRDLISMKDNGNLE
jgi:hypothetical protein